MSRVWWPVYVVLAVVVYFFSTLTTTIFSQRSRLLGELCALGYGVCASTVWKNLDVRGCRAGARQSGPSWAEFLRAQAKG